MANTKLFQLIRGENVYLLIQSEKEFTKIIEQSLARLKINGLLLVEHGYTQKNALTQLLSEFGYQSIQCWQDWQGHDRISGARICIEE